MSKVLRIIRREVLSENPGRDGAGKGAREKLGAKGKGSASEHDERRAEPRYACDYPARVTSSDRTISTAGRIVNISLNGAKVEVMYPRRGPTTIFLLDQANGEIYECEVRWRSDFFIGVRFLDVLGPGRRRKLRAGEEVPIKKSEHRVIQLDEPPKEELLPGPPPGRLFLGVEKEPSPDATPPKSPDAV